MGAIDRGVSVVDVTDARAPRLLRTLRESQGAWGVKIVGNRLYVGSFNGIVVYDISDRSNPSFLGRLLEGEETLGFCFDGDRLITTVEQGMKALEIGGLDEVNQISFFHTAGGFHAIRCAFGQIYTVRGGLYILRLEAP